MQNERTTESIVRTTLKKQGYIYSNGFIIEEQQSNDPQIRRLLNKASKWETNKSGYPDFIVRKENNKDNLIIVIECKANLNQHISKGDKLQPKDYAIDGALHYGSYLSQEYDVIAIGVSGQTNKDIVMDAILLLQNSNTPIPISTCHIEKYNYYKKKRDEYKDG